MSDTERLREIETRIRTTICPTFGSFDGILTERLSAWDRAVADMDASAKRLIAKFRAEGEATRRASGRIGERIEILFTARVDSGVRLGEMRARFEENG